MRAKPVDGQHGFLKQAPAKARARRLVADGQTPAAQDPDAGVRLPPDERPGSDGRDRAGFGAKRARDGRGLIVGHGDMAAGQRGGDPGGVRGRHHAGKPRVDARGRHLPRVHPRHLRKTRQRIGD